MKRSLFSLGLACLSVFAFASFALARQPAPASAPLEELSAVVTMGPGAACITSRDGRTTCTGANNSTARIAGLF